MALFNGILKYPLLGIIAVYRYALSPLGPSCCRFYPSCSQYAKLALQEKRIGVAITLIIKRLLKCHPFHPGGVDFIP